MRKTREEDPLKRLRSELDFLRKTFHETARSYEGRLEAAIAELNAAVTHELKSRTVPPKRKQDARAMIALVRVLKVRPEKGRRRDLRKIETLLEELQRFSDDW